MRQILKNNHFYLFPIMKFNSILSILFRSFLFLFSIYLLLYRVLFNSGHELCLEIEVLNFSSYKVTVLFLLDFVRVFFFSTVCLIARRIFIFRSSYIRNDKVSNRFLGIVLLFILRIGFLIFRPNLIRILLGWDGLGVTSYLLVCYYRSEKRFNARILTALSNRLGDVAILLFISINLNPAILNIGLFSSSNFRSLFFLSFILLAAITKRAQIPFSAWLPAAIAAPTPVSALVHSSTLVTAGVYLLIRFNFILFNSGLRCAVLWVGALTIFIAGRAALVELDIKKIIALSTLSQLGMIVFTLGLGETYLRWAHLIRHAYFKAIIFMGAGAIIHRVRGYQDVRKIGSLNKNNFFIFSIFLSGSFSLCGLPFLTGFYSKDVILEQFLINSFRIWLGTICYLATILTAAYSVRVILILFTFFSSRERASIEGDSNSRIRAGAFVLYFPAVAGGILIRCWNQFNPFVETPLWLKMSILVRILITAVLTKTRGVQFSPFNFLLSGLHQIWFLPNLVSPISSHTALIRARRINKFQEKTWLLWRAGGFVKVENFLGIFSALINVQLITSILIMIILTLVI